LSCSGEAERGKVHPEPAKQTEEGAKKRRDMATYLLVGEGRALEKGNWRKPRLEWENGDKRKKNIMFCMSTTKQVISERKRRFRICQLDERKKGRGWLRGGGGSRCVACRRRFLRRIKKIPARAEKVGGIKYVGGGNRDDFSCPGGRYPSYKLCGAYNGRRGGAINGGRREETKCFLKFVGNGFSVDAGGRGQRMGPWSRSWGKGGEGLLKGGAGLSPTTQRGGESPPHFGKKINP